MCCVTNRRKSGGKAQVQRETDAVEVQGLHVRTVDTVYCTVY